MMYNFSVFGYDRIVRMIATDVEYKQGLLHDGTLPAIPEEVMEVDDNIFTFLWMRRLKKKDGVLQGDVIHAIYLTLLEVSHVNHFEVALDAELIKQEDIDKFRKSKVWKEDLEPLF